MSDETPKKAEQGIGWTVLVVLVFVGVPVAIGGAVYLIDRFFFTDDELAVFRFQNNEAGGRVNAPSADTIHFRLHAECDTQMRSSEFGDELERAQLSIRVQDDGGAVQTVTCPAYNDFVADTHSREMRRRPKLDGIPLDCDISLRHSGAITVHASASWNGAHVRSAELHVTQ